MKTYNNLWDKICNIGNFRVAYKNAVKGKQHYVDVKRIERIGVNKYLCKLLNEVISGDYKVSEYHIFHRITGGKDREIYRLPMKDRIVQHAVMIYLEPIFRETFIVDTYSSIKFRGIHRGLQRVKKALKHNPNYKYYLKFDIHKCYPSLDKNILKDKLSNKIKDEKLLDLLFKIIDSCDKGVPIGNYTSQYFNNFYFNDFDHWIKEIKQVKAYFRYCDDIVILGETKEELWKLFEEIKIEIDKLNVKIKSNWQIYSIETKGIDFLGYIIRPDYIKLRKRTKLNFISKVSKMNLTDLTSKDVNVLGSYWGIFKHGNCRHLWYKYIGMKEFKDLNVKVRDREFVGNLVGVKLIITRCITFQKHGRDWIKFECDYNINNEEHKGVIVSTSGEKLIEAVKQINISDYPFSTTIIKDDKGFYNFV